MNLKFLRFSDEFFRCAYTRRNLAKFCLTFYLYTRGSGLLQGDLRFPGHLLWIGRFLRLKSIVVRCVHERGKVRLRFLAAFWERKKTGHRMRKSPVNNGGFLSFATKRSWSVLDVYVMQLYHDISLKTSKRQPSVSLSLVPVG